MINSRWLIVWSRAVLVPAWRRTAATWIGIAIVGGLVFGPSALSPREVTQLALHHVGVGVVLVVTWLLVFAPTARAIVRAEAASYLRSLPAPAVAPALIAAGALIAFQLPWLLLWWLGEGLLGLVVVSATTVLLVVAARWRPAARPSAWPGWRTSEVALRAVFVRGLRRRAGDALVRGSGLAVLAGTAAGLFVANNHLDGEAAGLMGAAVIAVVLVPAKVGVLMVVVGTHRETGWLAAVQGISHSARVAAVVYTIAVVELAASAIAVGAAIVVAAPDLITSSVLVALVLATGVASALADAAVVIAAERQITVAVRAVVGTIVVAAGTVLCLGLFDTWGVGALLAIGLLALTRAGGRR